MLGPIGSEIMAIFRLLSPDEIDKYIVEERSEQGVSGSNIKVAAGAESMSLTSGETHYDKKKDDKFPKDHQAKIIPLHGRNADEKDLLENKGSRNKNLDANKDENDQKNGHSLESIGLLSASQIRKIENERLKQEKQKMDSSTVFLLKEREKMRVSKRKLIEQTAIRSYQTSAAQEFYSPPENSSEEDENCHDIKGILLNKKHF